MKAAHRHPGRRGRRGHAVARHLPFDRRQAPAPPCRAGRPASPVSPSSIPTTSVRLLKQLIQAEGLDDKRWPARAVRADDRRLEEQGPRPHADIRGRCRGFANGKGRAALQRLPGPAEDAERLRLRRSALPPDPHLPRQSGRAQGIPPALPLHPRRRVPGHQHGAISLAQAARPAPRCGQGDRRAVNICCVGDDDQSIYGWRGAEVDNILRFEKDFPGATVIRLERNYRSTAHILGAASHLIAHNEGRLGKTLFTDAATRTTARSSCTPPGIREEEARAVGEEIERSPAQGRTSSTTWRSWCAPPSRCANSRTASSRSASTTASSAARASTSGMEIRDALAFFRVVAQPADDLAFERIVNVPKRGLGESTIRQIHDTARARAFRCWRPPPTRRKRRAEAEAARRAARSRRQFRALAQCCSKPCRTPSSPRPFSRRAATPTCGRTTARPRRRAGWKT